MDICMVNMEQLETLSYYTREVDQGPVVTYSYALLREERKRRAVRRKFSAADRSVTYDVVPAPKGWSPEYGDRWNGKNFFTC